MRLIDKAAKLLGFKTTYIVSHIAPAENGYAQGDMTVTVAPWITADNWNEVRAYVGKENNYASDKFSIVSCCKI